MAFRIAFSVILVGFVAVISRLIDGVTVDHGMGDTLESATGESVTLICDLRDIPGVNQIWFSDGNYYLSLGQKTDASVPSDKRNRLTVICYEPEETCELTISNIKGSDAGSYMCGFVAASGARRSLASVDLTVLVPPSDTSPVCRLYDDSNNPINSDRASIGNVVLFSCIVTGGTPRPRVYIDRDSVAMTPKVTSSFSHSYTLTKDDVGIYFSCIIEHPTLAKPRACLLLFLPGETTEPSKSTTTHSTIQANSTTNAGFHTIGSGPPNSGGKRNQTMAIPVSMSNTMFAVILTAVIVSVLVVITTVFCILACHNYHKRNKKHPVLSQPDYELTFSRDDSITAADHAIVNSHLDSLDSTNKPRSALIPSKPSIRLSRVNQHPDVIPIYAKPDKHHYGQQDHRSTDATRGHHCNTPQDGLMYADLDLPRMNLSKSTKRSVPRNEEATVYADILGTV